MVVGELNLLIIQPANNFLHDLAPCAAMSCWFCN